LEKNIIFINTHFLLLQKGPQGRTRNLQDPCKSSSRRKSNFKTSVRDYCKSTTNNSKVHSSSINHIITYRPLLASQGRARRRIHFKYTFEKNSSFEKRKGNTSTSL
jgi:hypothetical protein